MASKGRNRGGIGSSGAAGPPIPDGGPPPQLVRSSRPESGTWLDIRDLRVEVSPGGKSPRRDFFKSFDRQTERCALRSDRPKPARSLNDIETERSTGGKSL
jgi:hypothetical protein